MALAISSAFPTFTDASGDTLDAGYVYIGTSGLNAIDNQIAVYWDEALTTPAAQPIRTSGGYLQNSGSPGNLYTSAGSYSISVLDKNSVVVYSKLDVSTVVEVEAGDISSGSATNRQVLTADGSGGVTWDNIDLASTQDATTVTVTNTNGDDATIPSAGANAGVMSAADKTKLDGIETGATADQTDAEIETAYNNQVSVVDQSTAEAGTSTTVFRWTPERVAQAIASQASLEIDFTAYTTSGTWTRPTGATKIQVILIGGGGGGGGGGGQNGSPGGSGGGGGGGAGDFLEFTQDVSAKPSISYTVGAGGAGGAAGATGVNGTDGSDGGQTIWDTTFTTVISTGGAGGLTLPGSSSGGAGGSCRWGSNGGSGGRGETGISAGDSQNGGAGGSSEIFFPCEGTDGTGGDDGISGAEKGGGGGGGGALALFNSLGYEYLGDGGNGGFGGGFDGVYYNADAGAPATNYGGGGGGGGGSQGDSATNNASGAGGNGADGIILVRVLE